MSRRPRAQWGRQAHGWAIPWHACMRGVAMALLFSGALPPGHLSAHPPGHSAQDPDPRPIVEQASRAYQALTAFRADFHQLISDPMIGNFESRGRLTQAGESRLAMRFSDPAGEAIVMDGERLWVYTPSTTPGQVLRLKLPSDPAYGPNVLAWILTRATERYRCKYLRTDAVAGRAVDVIGLTPIDQSLPFTEAVVWLDQFDHLPRKLEIRERGGQQRTLTLTGVETNRRVTTGTFRFDIPPDVRIIDQ